MLEQASKSFLSLTRFYGSTQNRLSVSSKSSRLPIRVVSGKNPRLFLSSLTQPISFSVTFSDYVISINFSPIDRSKHRRTPAKSVVSRKRYLLSLSCIITVSSLYSRDEISRELSGLKEKLWNETLIDLEEIMRFFPSLESKPLNNL